MRRQKLILGVCSDPNAAAFLQLLHNWWSNELTESQNPRSTSIMVSAVGSFSTCHHCFNQNKILMRRWTVQRIFFFGWLLYKRAKPAPPPYLLPLPTYLPIPHTPPIRLREPLGFIELRSTPTEKNHGQKHLNIIMLTIIFSSKKKYLVTIPVSTSIVSWSL